jgi:hypothetical protein
MADKDAAPSLVARRVRRVQIDGGRVVQILLAPSLGWCKLPTVVARPMEESRYEGSFQRLVAFGGTPVREANMRSWSWSSVAFPILVTLAFAPNCGSPKNNGFSNNGFSNDGGSNDGSSNDGSSDVGVFGDAVSESAGGCYSTCTAQPTYTASWIATAESS